jgi:hypothetical protein
LQVLLDLYQMSAGNWLSARDAAMGMRADRDRIRKDYPEAGEREVFLRAAATRLGADTVRKVYGWDPESGKPL